MVIYALLGSQAKVPHDHAQPSPGEHRRMHNGNHRCQLKQQAWLNPQWHVCHSQPSRPVTSLAATAKSAVHSEAVRAEFSAAGIPEEVTSKVLQQYSHYLGWDPDTKLRPALQLWLKQLGNQQLSERLDKYPQLLLRTPEDCNDVFLWLASLGLDAEGIQQKVPAVMGRQLNAVQSTVQTIQNALELTNEKLPEFFQRHASSLRFSPDRVARTLQTVAELLAVPVASKEMQKVIMVCSQDLFDKVPAVLHHKVSFFCKEFEGGPHAAKAALKQGIYRVSVDLMRERAAELKEMLGCTQEECNHVVSSTPRLLTHQPATLANNIQKLQAHSFSSAQVLKMCTLRPNLAGYDWSSPSNVEKLMYLRLVLQASTTELAIKPQWLNLSLALCVGPRCEFMYRSRAITADTPLALSKCSSYLHAMSDAKFAIKFNIPSANPPLIYDEDFKQHWWQRWKFLRQEMKLSVADISACRALLFTSLPNILAPRWRFLNMLEAAQAGFKAADHLTALATLSDELFAETFETVDVGLTFDKNFIQLV